MMTLAEPECQRLSVFSLGLVCDPQNDKADIQGSLQLYLFFEMHDKSDVITRFPGQAVHAVAT